jgi:hypothetical protein
MCLGRGTQGWECGWLRGVRVFMLFARDSFPLAGISDGGKEGLSAFSLQDINFLSTQYHLICLSSTFCFL